MTAEIISVGTELLLGQTLDTHSATMGKILADCGVVCQRRATVGDNLDRIVSVLKEAIGRADVVVMIGGLGPTMDDLTRDAIALALGDELIREPAMEQELRDMVARRGFKFYESFLRQADRPASAQFIENDFGSAPGLIAEKDGKRVIALPGPSGEFGPMANGAVRAYLAALTGEVIHSVVVRVAGMGEKVVEEAVKDLMSGENPTVAPYAHLGEVHLRVTARARTKEEATTLIEPVLAQISAILGDNVFATDATSLEEALTHFLISRGETVAVAESMTGGELAARLSSTPGSSACFLGGVTVYSAGAKSSLLDIDSGLIQRVGAVSSEVATELAVSVRARLNATYGIGIVGNAGPTVDSGGKPIGYFGVAIATADGVEFKEWTSSATRADIRRRATQLALTWLRDLAIAR
ncbi:competence/damage-inducible protein A [soil metagenome]